MADTLPQFTLGSGEVLTAKDSKEVEHFREMGLKELTADDQRTNSLKEQYSSWMLAPEGFALGVADAVLPGATSAVVNTLGAFSPELGLTTGDFIKGVKAAHPLSSTVGQVAGAVGGGIETLAQGAVRAAELGALGGAARSADSLALEHIGTPEGAEKVAATIGLGALIGGAVNVGAQGLGSWIGKRGFGKLGQELESSATGSIASKTLGNPGVQARLDETGAQESAMALAQKYELLDKAPKVVRAKLADVIKSSEVELNQVKALSSETLLAEQAALSQDLAQLTQGTPVKLSSKFASEPQTLGDLHQLRIKIDKAVNWRDPSSEASQKLIQARESVNQFMSQVVAKAGQGTDAAERWATANGEYSAAKSLQDAMRYSEATGTSFLGNIAGKLKGTGKFGVGAGIGTMNPLGVAGGAGTYAAGMAVEQLAESNVAPMVVKGLGKAIQAFDNEVVSSIENGLARAGATPNGAAAVENAFKLTDYDVLSAKIKWTGENPTEAVPQVAEHMASRNIPGPVIDAALPSALKAAAYLKTQVPIDPWAGSTVAPLPYQPTLRQKAQFVDKVNALNNPIWAINNPTPERLAAVQAVYPELIAKVSNLTAQEAATRVHMALVARKWASAITGIPATPLSTPMARTAMASAGQPQQSPSGANGPKLDVNESRLNRMSE